MSYTPINLSMYLAAFSGALAGMGASDRVPTDSNPAHYTGLVSTAGAFAEAFDIAWDNVHANTYNFAAAKALSEDAWQERTPLVTSQFTSPDAYTTLARALVAMIMAGDTYLTDQGIVVPDSCCGILAATEEPNWYIDAINGNNDNLGTTLLAPLQSHAELERRWGASPTLKPPVNVTVSARLLTIHILSDLPETDPINFDVALYQDVSVRYLGIGQTEISTGTFTAVTAKVPGTDSAFEITDNTKALNFWANNRGMRVRITAGPRLNTIMWVAKELAVGKFRPLDPSIPNSMASAAADNWTLINVVETTPQVGDAYAVEQPWKVTWGRYSVKSAGMSDIGVFFPPELYVENLAIGVRDDNPPFQGVGNIQLRCVACQFVNYYMWAQSVGFDLRTFLINCGFGIISTTLTFFAGVFVCLDGGFVEIQGGGFIGFDADNPARILGFSGQIYLTFDVMVQTGQVQGSDIRIQSLSVFDSVDSKYTPNGDAVRCSGSDIGTGLHDSDGQSVGETALGTWNLEDVNVRLWGSGNAGVGVSVGSGSSFLWKTTVPTITGTGGDFLVAASAKARAWDEGGGAYTAARACTWANVAATVGAGGFGGSAHNVQQNAHVLQAQVGE